MEIVNKKGVSPLVASILLVAIVIVIAFLVFWWYGDYVAENLDKSGITADQACMQDVGFSITNVNCLQNSLDTNKLVYFDLENTGDIGLSAFKVSIDGNLADDVKSISQEVREGVTSKLSFEYDFDVVGNTLTTDIVPLIWAGGGTKYCKDKTQTINVVCLSA